MLTKLGPEDLAPLIVPRFLRPPFCLLRVTKGLHLSVEIEETLGARAVLRHPRQGTQSRLQTSEICVPNKEETQTQTVAPPAVQRWLNVGEAASYLGISTSYLRALIHDGGIKAARVGNTFRLDRLDLDTLMLRRKRIVAPYRRGTKPWVAALHRKNRKRALRSR
jgi:excisionase family DNA binding protein